MIDWVCNSRHVSGKPACCLCKYLPYRTIKLALLLLSCYCHTLLFLHDSLLLPFMEPESSSQSPQGSANSPHSKPHELNSSFHVLFFKVNFNIILPFIKWFLPFRLSHWRLYTFLTHFMYAICLKIFLLLIIAAEPKGSA